LKIGIVIGVSGQIGIAVARRMPSNGWAVRGLHARVLRSPPIWPLYGSRLATA